MTLTQLTNQCASWAGRRRRPPPSSFKPEPSPYTNSNLRLLASFSSDGRLEEYNSVQGISSSPCAAPRRDDVMSLGSSNFVERSAPPMHSKKVGSRSLRSRGNSVDTRLSIIAEDGVLPPPPPARTQNRFFNRRWNIGEPPRHSFETPPPKYSVWDATGPKGEKLADVRNNKHIAQRGGWRRIFLISFLIIVIIIALVAGLVVGLRKKTNDSSPPPPASSNSSSSPGPFPAGSYTFTTFLSTVSTNCTSQPNDWVCPPGSHTYASSPSEALATFTWIITAASWTSETDFTISSSNNPFAFSFTNASLSLQDANTPNERYNFSTSIGPRTTPMLGTTCYYDGTILEANLYTRRSKTYPSSPSGPSSAPATPSSTSAPNRDGFQDWQFAVEITEHINGGADVPACYQTNNNGQRGNRVTDGLVPQPASSVCSCGYKNFGN